MKGTALFRACRLVQLKWTTALKSLASHLVNSTNSTTSTQIGIGTEAHKIEDAIFSALHHRSANVFDNGFEPSNGSAEILKNIGFLSISSSNEKRIEPTINLSSQKKGIL